MQGYFSKILLLQTLCLGLLASSAFGESNATSKLNSKLNLSTTLPTYELGAVEVTAPQEIDYNPSIQSTTFRDIQEFNADNIAQAVRFTPGVLMSEATARRGEPSLSIRGFNGTQIGLFLDGIPMMSIYDKQTDFGQYVTQGIGSIQVSKGFASPVYGMNTLGGAINIISHRPQKELEISVRQKLLFGAHSSPDEVRQGFGIGSNVGKFYFQADISHTDRSTYPLSSDFKPTIIQPKGDKTKCLNADGSASSAGFCGTNSIYDDNTLGLILILGYDIYENTNAKFGINTKKDTHLSKDASTKAINTELKELTTSIFAQYSQRLGVFRAVVAGSYDFIEPLNIDFKDGQGDVKDKQPELDDGYSLQGVLYYDLSSAQSVHFTLGKKNNLPTLKQHYSSLWGAQVKSPGLDIENAINYELGYDLALGSTNLSVAVFYNDMKNMFV